MVSPGQKKGSSGHIMAVFDTHQISGHIAGRKAQGQILVHLVRKTAATALFLPLNSDNS